MEQQPLMNISILNNLNHFLNKKLPKEKFQFNYATSLCQEFDENKSEYRCYLKSIRFSDQPEPFYAILQ